MRECCLCDYKNVSVQCEPCFTCSTIIKHPNFSNPKTKTKKRLKKIEDRLDVLEEERTIPVISSPTTFIATVICPNRVTASTLVQRSVPNIIDRDFDGNLIPKMVIETERLYKKGK